MTQELLERTAAADEMTGIVDCDIHPSFVTRNDLASFLPQCWREHVRDYGMRTANPTLGALPYPRINDAMRRDSYPPEGGMPGSSLSFMREHLLDPLNIEVGILQPIGPGGATFNLELGVAVSSAMNDWQAEVWLSKEKRLKGSIQITQENTAASVREIEARARDRRFVQIAMPPRTIEPSGRERYWPIYEAAESLGLPIGMHPVPAGTHANTPAGWTSFYIEEHYSNAHPPQSALVSMIFEGVFERFPKLKLVLIEGGFGWLAPLMWRMDREWERLRGEVPHIKMKPSEYVRRNVWLTTQPVEEPINVRHMTNLLKWIGTDRLMFSTDYPHWDFDHPDRAFRVSLTPQEKQAIFRDNARAVFPL